MRFANRLGIATAVLASGALAGSGFAMAAAGGVAKAPAATPASFGFSTMDNAADPTFNQLLGIKDHGLIAGYFGSGAQDHPNRGYLLSHGTFISENFPQSVQTQVTGLNNRGVTVGFWSTMNNASQVNDNFGFWAANGQFHAVSFPANDNASPPVNQLLGVNDENVAVGFYTDANGNNHGYEYRIGSGRFTVVTIPGATSSTAAAIDDRGDVAGFYTNAAGDVQGYLKSAFGQLTNLAFPGATTTNALGLNDRDEVVGVYTVGTGNNAVSHGFTWTSRGGFATVDDPNGIGATTINGLNDRGDLVGFYVSGDGNTHGFLATAAHRQFFAVRLAPMPAGSVTVGHDQNGNLTATLQAFGLTPGSTHNVSLVDRNGVAIAALSPLTADGAGQLAGTATSTFAGPIPDGSRLVIALDTTAGSTAIAGTAQLTAGLTAYRLNAVEVGNGTSFGTPHGWASIAYDPAAKTITVRVTASGFTPGLHAAHIHVGSCQNQGGVMYMLMDLSANAQGQIVNEVRTVTGANSPIPAGAWYLNVHQGDSNQILANGKPTALFRPLTCGQIG